MTHPHEQREAVAVTQADREAAGDYCAIEPIFHGTNVRKGIRLGKQDGHPLVQAFARHRLAAEQTRASTPAVDREAIARAIKSADDAFGYSLRLTKLVDGEAEYTLTYADGSGPMIFASNEDAYEHIAVRRSEVRADAILSLHPSTEAADTTAALEKRVAVLTDALQSVRLEISPTKAYAEQCGLEGGKLASPVHIKLDLIDGYCRAALNTDPSHAG